MSLFQLSQEEIMTFFMVLLRMSILLAVLPFFGDRMVPGPVKILLSVALSLLIYPYLIKSGSISPSDALIWGRTASGIVMTAALEVLVALSLGFVAKLAFEAIQFGANLIGTYMGLASASQYDPHQESQTQMIAQLQMAIAMLLFLSIDAHHVMLLGIIDSYRTVGLGQMGLGQFFANQWIEITASIFRFALQLSAPVAVVIFGVNVAFGVIAKAMPQVNILVLSMGATAFIGMIVLLIGLPEFGSVSAQVFERMGDWMHMMMQTLKG